MNIAKICTALTSASLAACSAAQSAPEKPEIQRFEIGPSDDPDRIVLNLPSKYLKGRPDLRNIWDAPSFAVNLGDFGPAPQNLRGDPSTVYLNVNWISPHAVERRTDGTYLNHFSGYNVSKPDLYGMKRFAHADSRYRPAKKSFLLFEPTHPAMTMIECEQEVAHVTMYCNMDAEFEKGLLISIGFSPNNLSKWRELRARAEAFYRPMISFGPQTPIFDAWAGLPPEPR